MLTILLAPDLELIFFEMRYMEDLISLEKHDAQNQTMVNTVEDDSSPHLRSDNVFISSIRHSLQ
jgi:hypothetical protein